MMDWKKSALAKLIISGIMERAAMIIIDEVVNVIVDDKTWNDFFDIVNDDTTQKLEKQNATKQIFDERIANLSRSKLKIIERLKKYLPNYSEKELKLFYKMLGNLIFQSLDKSKFKKSDFTPYYYR